MFDEVPNENYTLVVGAYKDFLINDDSSATNYYNCAASILNYCTFLAKYVDLSKKLDEYTINYYITCSFCVTEDYMRIDEVDFSVLREDDSIKLIDIVKEKFDDDDEFEKYINKILEKKNNVRK